MINKYDLYSKLIKKYGKEKQIIVAIEELSELQKELTKYLRGLQTDYVSIAEEITDVEIMCEQLKFIFCCDWCCWDMKWSKFERIKKLVENKNDTRDE